jgi:hypothetical protein
MLIVGGDPAGVNARRHGKRSARDNITPMHAATGAIDG